MLDFFEKKPRNRKEWNEETANLQVFTGFLSEMITQSVRSGVILALKDSFK